MPESNKLSIQPGAEGFILNTGGKNKITAQDLSEILSAENLSKIHDLQLANKREEYDKFKPAGFEYAPQSAKQKREELENTDYVQKMKWCQDNISYNVDHTMNIIKLKKTFCEDISGTGKNCNWEDAKQLAESKGYKMLTDYNDTDADEIKQESDWYRVMNLFGGNTGNAFEGIRIFSDMAGFNDRYWTATCYKDSNGKLASDVARYRLVSENSCHRLCSTTNKDYRVCGFKSAP